MTRPAAPEPRPGFALFIAAFFASPLILVCWAGGCALQRATGWPRWRLFAAAVAGGALIVWMQGGPVPALSSHFSGYLGPAVRSSAGRYLALHRSRQGSAPSAPA